MRSISVCIALACVVSLASIVPAMSADGEKLAIFTFELYDTSLEGEVRGADPAEAARLEMITDLLRDAYRDQGGYELVDTDAMQERLATMPKLRTCNGCESRLAREVGADQVVTGFVQKISTLILSLSMSVHDAETGNLVRKYNASIRGNTDESWSHGVRYLIRNQLFEEQQ
ncbi:DUF3280 domain-containing protein [Rhizobium sp. EC-SD404]|uniref:DUF3280 domain-containing protein n=1 Tax=Rhizobium sp. EC-SD404 TaxID=2038389 RepID=UPI00125885FE|nr:DUF3280 domain-containing protein [Rhizobium sp. EC-SD404]VVT02811.1 conserved exported hypothetical protein [Rhizobium sp. EC-SD404]